VIDKPPDGGGDEQGLLPLMKNEISWSEMRMGMGMGGRMIMIKMTMWMDRL